MVNATFCTCPASNLENRWVVRAISALSAVRNFQVMINGLIIGTGPVLTTSARIVTPTISPAELWIGSRCTLAMDIKSERSSFSGDMGTPPQPSKRHTVSHLMGYSLSKIRYAYQADEPTIIGKLRKTPTAEHSQEPSNGKYAGYISHNSTDQQRP